MFRFGNILTTTRVGEFQQFPLYEIYPGFFFGDGVNQKYIRAPDSLVAELQDFGIYEVKIDLVSKTVLSVAPRRKDASRYRTRRALVVDEYLKIHDEYVARVSGFETSRGKR